MPPLGDRPCFPIPALFFSLVCPRGRSYASSERASEDVETGKVQDWGQSSVEAVATVAEIPVGRACTPDGRAASDVYYCNVQYLLHLQADVETCTRNEGQLERVFICE